MRRRFNLRRLGERRRLLCGFALLLFSLPAGVRGESVSALVAHSTRKSNNVVLALLLGSDTTTALEAAHALGRRRDPYVGDILEGLLSRSAGPDSYRDLFVLRVVMDETFLLPRPALAKIAINSRALTFLLSKLQAIPDAEAKKALLEISRFLPASASAKALLREGAFLIGYLRRTGGNFAPERLDEATAFLSACAVHDNAVLANEVITLRKLSRSAAFVRAADRYLAAAP